MSETMHMSQVTLTHPVSIPDREGEKTTYFTKAAGFEILRSRHAIKISRNGAHVYCSADAMPDSMPAGVVLRSPFSLGGWLAAGMMIASTFAAAIAAR